MTIDQAVSLVRAVITDLGLGNGAPVTAQADLRRDLDVDSIDFLDVLFEVNGRCGLALTLEGLREYGDATRVGRLAAYVVAAVAARDARAHATGASVAAGIDDGVAGDAPLANPAVDER